MAKTCDYAATCTKAVSQLLTPDIRYYLTSAQSRGDQGVVILSDLKSERLAAR